MSQQYATYTAGPFHRAANIFRYSAIVTAGMASIGLTVTAGAYIVHEMAVQSGTLSAMPAGHAPGFAPGAGSDEPETEAIPAPLPENRVMPAFFTDADTENAVRQPVSEPNTVSGAGAAKAARPAATALTGQLRLGNAYVGAQVVPVQSNSVRVTLDTNVVATLADLAVGTPLGGALGIGSQPRANTQVSSQVDDHGDLTVTFSDPALGEYGWQIARHPAPRATSAVGKGSAVVTESETAADAAVSATVIGHGHDPAATAV